MKHVLLITYSHDNKCIEMVSDAIKKQGGKPVRFNTDLYPDSSAITVEYKNGQWRNLLETEEGVFDLSTFESVWYRRIRIGNGLYKTLEDKYLHAAIEESRRTFFGMLASLDVFQMDNFLTVRRAENKQLQLKIAERLGLKIPQTLMTNRSSRVKDFFPACKDGMITKMQTAFAIYEDGVENVVFTNTVDNEVLEDMDDLKYCPMTFQDNIIKKLELRITIVGDKVFAASIDSQSSELARNDWRKQGIEMINDWKVFDLPKSIEQKLLKLMDELKLNYGGVDMILTHNDELIFLEVNPVGEFFWLELNPGFPISEAIADVLLGKGHRRN